MARMADNALPSPALKPLWGMGVVGGIGLVVFAALVTALVAGVDLVDGSVQVLCRAIGVEGTEQLLRQVTVQAITSSAPGFTIFALPVMVVAFFIQPRPMGVWRYLLVIASTIAVGIAIAELWVWGPQFTPGTANPSLGYLERGLRVIALPALVAVLTRSGLVAAYGLIAAVMVAVIEAAGVTPLNPQMNPALVTGWPWSAVPSHALYPVVFGAGLFHWAIRDRLRAQRWSASPACMRCGYDATKHRSAVCPECGASLDHLPDRETNPEGPSAT